MRQLKYTLRKTANGEFVSSIDENEARSFVNTDAVAVFVETPTGGPRRVLMWRGVQPWVAGSTGMPEPM